MLPAFLRKGKAMNCYLTDCGSVPNRVARRTPPGMMFWSGTCSDPNATCGGCKHYGFSEVVRGRDGNVRSTVNHPTKCALYYKQMGEPAKKPIERNTPACKYFEAKQPAQAK
jgi:hypothetical protein